MEYRTLGDSGAHVSVLGFGCMRLPILEGDTSRIDTPRALEMVRYAIDQGVNYIDTAWPYHGKEGHAGGGMSEPFVAEVLEDGYRQKVQLATKLPSWLIESEADFDRFLDAQLERLKTDHIDMYLLHALNRKNWEKLKSLEVLSFLEQAKADGRIVHAGFSFHDEGDLFRQIIDAYKWDFTQIQYNYFDVDYQAGREGLRYAASRGIGVIVMEPLRGGSLVTLPEELVDSSGLERHFPDAVEAAFQWLYSQEEVSLVLSGMSNMQQVEQNVAIASRARKEALDEDQRLLFDHIREELVKRTKVGCTGCGYCMPCPSGVDIPTVFRLYNNSALFVNDNSGYVYSRLLPKKARASECIACGSCLDKCPQQLPIIELLEEADKALRA